MRRSLFILALASTGCVPKINKGPVPIQEASKPVPILEMQESKSPNLYLQAMIRAGSSNDASGKEGLAYLTARSLVEGGAGERSPDEIRERLYPTGNDLEVLVQREYVSIKLKCHTDHSSLCIETFVDVLTRPQFQAQTVDRIRTEAIYTVTKGLLGDEEALGEEVLHHLLFDGHPYGHPIAGRAGVIPLLTSDDVQRFYEEHYKRSTIQVGLGGAYDATMLEQLQTGLEALSTRLPPDQAMQSPIPQSGRQIVAVSTGTPVTGFHVGHLHHVDRNHADWPALYVATMALGAHRQSSGRLFESLRTKRGLNYGDYAYMEAFKQRGWSTYPEQGAILREPMFYLWLRPTSTENGPFALKLAIDELERWVSNGLTEAEFETVRQYALGHLPLEAQNTGRRLAYAMEARMSGTPHLLDTLPEQLRALTLTDVNAAIQQHIRPDTLFIVAVTQDGDALIQQLKNGVETPIQYANATPSPQQAERDQDIANKDLNIEIEEAAVVPAQGIFR